MSGNRFWPLKTTKDLARPAENRTLPNEQKPVEHSRTFWKNQTEAGTRKHPKAFKVEFCD